MLFRSRGQYVIDRIFGDVRKIDMENLLMDLKRKLLECDTYAQMAEHLSICIAGLKCREMYVLMNTDLMDMDTIEVEALEDYREEYITEGYPDDMKVVYACHGNKNCRNICKSDKSLVPDLWEEKDFRSACTLSLSFFHCSKVITISSDS